MNTFSVDNNPTITRCSLLLHWIFINSSIQLFSNEKAGETDDIKIKVETENDGDIEMETSQMEKTTDEGKESGDKTSSPEKKKDDGSSKKSEARHAESRYAAVAISQMFCHVCNKHMWDGFSFENHLRGRAHQLMMDKLDESYKLKVDLMRHELRVSEEQRDMSLTNSKRRGKKVSVDLNVREYCTMCDLNFYGTLSSHRKSDKHQQLKTFLHPRCHPCVKEFPSRIEYDEHCLTPTHMLAASQDEQKKSKKVKLPKGESEVRTAEDEENDSGTPSKPTDKDEDLTDETDYITDIQENMDLTVLKIPTFKYCRNKQLPLGASLVKEVQGFHCEKCKRFMLTQEDMNAHLKTTIHYRNFFSEIKALTALSSEEKAKAASEGKEEEAAATEDGERELKRPRLEDDTENEKSTEEEKAPELEESVDEKGKEEGDDKYDPLEAAESDEEKDKTEMDVEEDVSKKDDEKAADVWEDIDNEDESEVGNLIDGDEKTEAAPETPQTPQIKPQPQNTSTPAVSASSTTPAVSTPATAPATPAPAITPATAATPSTPTVPDPPIITKTPTNQMPNHSPMNNSGNNSANKNRGRGYRGGGGRGHQRARRSRR
uniref:CIZ1 protein n=1 Tax=Fopius arisanus TaxID=64838 RepID=A0A0C9RFR3_9HYME